MTQFKTLPLPLVGGGKASRAMDLGARRTLVQAAKDWVGNSRDHGERVARLALVARLLVAS